MGKKPAPPQRPPAKKLKKQNQKNNGKKQNLSRDGVTVPVSADKYPAPLPKKHTLNVLSKPALRSYVWNKV